MPCPITPLLQKIASLHTKKTAFLQHFRLQAAYRLAHNNPFPTSPLPFALWVVIYVDEASAILEQEGTHLRITLSRICTPEGYIDSHQTARMISLFTPIPPSTRSATPTDSSLND